MITIGSDPEFAVIENGKIKDAYKLFNDKRYEICHHNRQLQCHDPCKIPNLYCGHHYLSAEIGSDCGFGEFRPVAGNTPLEHRDNLEHLIKVMEIPDDLKLFGGTHYGGGGLGGHIHIGMPNLDYTLTLSNFLSYYCGIPLKKIELPDDLRRRGLVHGNYGYFGNYHDKSYGIEWRMPASWLISREITTASLCLAYVVASQYNIQINHKNSISHAEYLGLIGGDISSIIADIEKMDIYKLYCKEIEPIFQLIINKECWDPSHDFREGWL